MEKTSIKESKIQTWSGEKLIGDLPTSKEETFWYSKSKKNKKDTNKIQWSTWGKYFQNILKIKK